MTTYSFFLYTAFKQPRGSEESNLAGHTPKIRSDYNLPDDYSSSVVVDACRDQALVSRLWTTHDFVNSPTSDHNASPATQQAALALTQLSTRYIHI